MSRKGQSAVAGICDVPFVTVDVAAGKGGGLGVAVFTKESAPPVASAVIRTKVDTLPERAQYFADAVREAVEPLSVGIFQCALVIEYPGLWAGSAQSQAAASRGDTFGLAYACGVIAAEFCGDQVHLVSPQQWKGNAPKDVIIRRLNRRWGPGLKLRDHEADAWGMGAAVFGLL